MPERFDTVIRGGSVVIPYRGTVRTDIGIIGERIAALGDDLGEAGGAATIIDASGRTVFPGCVDTHSHYGHFNEFYGEMQAESANMAALGITTSLVLLDRSVKSMEGWIHRRSDQELFAQPDTEDKGLGHHMFRASYHLVVPEAIERSAGRSAMDFSFHLGICAPGQIAEIGEYVDRYGVTSFKAWPSLYPWAALGEAEMVDFLEACRDHGALPYVNTVNTALQRRTAARTYAAAGVPEAEASPALFRQANSDPLVETFDMQTTMWLARSAGSPRLCIVHVTSADGVEMLAHYRDDLGLEVQGEAGSVWLDLSWPEVGMLGHRATCIIPQLGEASDVDALWEGVRRGLITVTGTDGVISPRPTFPDGSQNPMYVPPPTVERRGLGFPSHIVHFPIVLDSAARRGFDDKSVAELCSANPAKLFDLYPRKGTIAVGSDADLVVVDREPHTIRASELATTAPFNPWEGRIVSAWPVLTMLRGDVIAKDGRFLGSPRGRYLPRSV